MKNPYKIKYKNKIYQFLKIMSGNLIFQISFIGSKIVKPKFYQTLELVSQKNNKFMS